MLHLQSARLHFFEEYPSAGADRQIRDVCDDLTRGFVGPIRGVSPGRIRWPDGNKQEVT